MFTERDNLMLFIRFFVVIISVGSFLPSVSIAFQKKAASQTRRTKAPAPTPTPAPVSSGALSIDVGLIKGNGDVHKVARNEFTLTTKSLFDILQSINYASYLPRWQRNDITQLNRWYIYDIYNSNPPERSKLEILQVQEALKKYTVQIVKTDFYGQAKFVNVQPGEYYILGHTMYGILYYVWNPKITINPGANSLILDNDNAMKQ